MKAPIWSGLAAVALAAAVIVAITLLLADCTRYGGTVTCF
jgi:hypothetical protein